jgi:hypothetical protein
MYGWPQYCRDRPSRVMPVLATGINSGTVLTPIAVTSLGMILQGGPRSAIGR